MTYATLTRGRRRSGELALLWLAQRVAAHPHDAITAPEVDDDLVGRLLRIMADCHGMGMTLDRYPPAPIVLAAHAGHLGRLAPTAARCHDDSVIVEAVATTQCGCTTAQRDEIVRRYVAVLGRRDAVTG